MSAVLQEIVSPQSESLRVDIAVTPEVAAAVKPSGALAIARAYDIDCPEIAQVVADDMKGWAQRIDRLEAMKKDLIAPAKKALEEMRVRLGRWFDAPLADLIEARELAGKKLVAWNTAEMARVAAEKAKRDAEERRLRQEAEKKAAEERAKAEELARVERQKAQAAEAERQRAIEEAEKQRREGNAKAAAEADRLAKQKAQEAAAAESKERAALENGAAKAMQVELQAAAQTPAPVVDVQKIAGTSMRDNWMAELAPGVSLEAAKLDICKAIAAGRHELLPLVDIDTAPRGSLNKLAAALRGAMNVPGFRAVNKQTLAAARR